MILTILRAILYVSAGLDLGSTWKGMSAGQKEANPILGQNRLVQGVIVFGSIIVVDLVSRWAQGQGSTFAAVLVLASVSALHLVAFLLNLRSFK